MLMYEFKCGYVEMIFEGDLFFRNIWRCFLGIEVSFGV